MKGYVPSETFSRGILDEKGGKKSPGLVCGRCINQTGFDTVPFSVRFGLQSSRLSSHPPFSYLVFPVVKAFMLRSNFSPWFFGSASDEPMNPVISISSDRRLGFGSRTGFVYRLALGFLSCGVVGAFLAERELHATEVVATEVVATEVVTQDGGAGASNAAGVIQPGDRIALIGSGWVERMHRHPWFEMMLSMEVPGVTFRNMGWSGDTVHGDARAVFGSRQDGYQRLIKDSEIAAPNLAILCYGENEAFLNEAERAEFLKGYRKLIDDLKSKGSRVVLVIPRQREDAGPEFPNPAYYNSNLAQVANGIRALAKETGAALIDLEKFAPDQRFTEEGIAWNDKGYRASAKEMMRQLGFANPALDRVGLNKPELLEELRTAVASKNEWFFHRYRPQNETYLFLFRKHEQGNNAVEVEQMEQFVRDGEAKITQWLKDNQVAPIAK